jgi:hypothetical protein
VSTCITSCGARTTSASEACTPNLWAGSGGAFLVPAQTCDWRPETSTRRCSSRHAQATHRLYCEAGPASAG